MAKKASTDKNTQPNVGGDEAPKKNLVAKPQRENPGEKPAAKKKAARKSSAVKAEGEKVAPTKASKKTAAKNDNKTSAPKPASKKAAKKIAKSTSSRKSAKKELTDSPSPTVTIAASEEQQPSAGTIKPTVKRPAYLPPINGNLVVRQQRRFAEPGKPSGAGIERDYSLPEGYERTFVSIHVRDAEWLYVYWEIASPLREELGLGGEGQSNQLMLRLHDITGIDFDGTNAVSRADIPVNDLTSSWYVHVPQAGRRYLIELGIAGARGEFHSIARSNSVNMPSAKISDEVDWEWQPGDEESHLQILRLSGGADIPLHLSSAEFVNELRRRFLEESAGFSGELFSGALLGSEFASQTLGGARQHALQRDRGFWLVVNTEVIVYGATDPDARVKFMGREIKLNEDGTFGIRMILPEGKLEFPIEATSPDEIETRSVCPIVSRKTV